MSAQNLPDESKAALDEALATLQKAVLKWRKCLTVQTAGIGFYSPSAAATAEREFNLALEEVRAITADEVPEEGLLREIGEQEERGAVTSVTLTHRRG